MHEQSSQHWLAEKIPSLASAIRFSGCLLGLAEINIPDGESASFVSKLQRIRDLQDEFIELAEERGLTLAVSSSKNAKSWGSRASQELQTGYLTHRSQQSWSFAGTPVKSGITESTQLKSQSNFTTSSNIAVEELEHLKTVSREFSRLVDEWSQKAKSYVSHQSVLVKGFDTNPPPAKNSTPTPADLKSLGTSLDVKTLSPVVSYNYSDTPSKQGGVSPELTMRNGENSGNKLGHKPVVSDVTSASKRYGSRVVKLAENDYTVCDTPREGTIDLIEDNQPIFTGELTNSPSKYYKVVRPHKNEVEYIQPRYRHDNPNYKETVKMTVQLEPKSSEKTKKTSDPSKAEPAPPSAFQIEEQPLFGSEESDINRVLFKTRDDVKDVILQIHDDSLVRDTWSHIKSNKELTPSGNDTDANTRGWTDEGRVYEKELDPAHLVNWLDPKSPDKPLFSDERSPNKCPSPPALELTPLKPQLRAGDLGTITEQEEEGTRRSDPTEPPETDVRNSIIPPPSVVQDTEKAEPQIAVKERTSLLSSMSEAGPISSLKPAGLPAITFDVDVPYLISVNQLPTSVTEMSVTHVYDDTQQEEICSVDYSHSSGVLMIATSVSLRCWKTDQQGKWVLQATKTLEKNEFGYRVKLLSGGMDCLFSGWGELHVYVLRTSDLETLSKTSIGRLKSPRNPQIANAHKEPAYNVWSNPWESYAFPHFSHTGDLNIYHVYDDTKVKIEGFWAVDEQVSSHICLDSYDGSHNFIGVGKLKEEYTLHLAVLKQPNVEVLKEKQAISASIAAEHFQEYSTSSMLLSSLDGIPPIKSVLSMFLLSQPITTEENELKVALLIKKPDDTYCLCLVSFLTSLNGNPKVWVSSGHPLGDTIQTEPTLRTITDTVRLFKVPNVYRVMVQSGNRLAEWTLSETSTELSLTTSSQILNDTKVVSEKEYPFLQNGQLITLQLRTLGSDSPGIGLWLGAIPLYKNTAPDAIEERTAEELVSFTKMFTPDPKEAQRCSQLPEPMVWLESQHGGRNIFYQSEEYNAYLHTAGSDNEAFHTKSGQKPAIPLYIRFRQLQGHGDGGIVITTTPNNCLSLLSPDLNVVETLAGNSDADISSDLFLYRHFTCSTPSTDEYLYHPNPSSPSLVSFSSNTTRVLGQYPPSRRSRHTYCGLLASQTHRVLLVDKCIPTQQCFLTMWVDTLAAGRRCRDIHAREFNQDFLFVSSVETDPQERFLLVAGSVDSKEQPNSKGVLVSVTFDHNTVVLDTLHFQSEVVRIKRLEFSNYFVLAEGSNLHWIEISPQGKLHKISSLPNMIPGGCLTLTISQKDILVIGKDKRSLWSIHFPSLDLDVIQQSAQ